MTGTASKPPPEEGTARRRESDPAVVAKLTSSTVTRPSSPLGTTSVAASSVPVDNSPVGPAGSPTAFGRGIQICGWDDASSVHPQIPLSVTRCTGLRPEMETTRSEPRLAQDFRRKR